MAAGKGRSDLRKHVAGILSVAYTVVPDVGISKEIPVFEISLVVKQGMV